MKNYITKTLSACAGVLLGAAASQAAVPVSPVGTWDCNISGAQGRGVAYITFNEDYTFTGYSIMTVKPLPSSSPTSNPDQRNDGGNVGRSDGSTGTNTVVTAATAGGSTNLYGFSQITGPWTYDLVTGKAIGFFKQSVLDETGTNISIISVGVSAKVGAGPRLNLVTSTPSGKTYYTGKPVSPTFPDLTGTWYAYNKQNGATMVEFFTLMPSGLPGLYEVSDGKGAGYTFHGYAIASGWKKLGFSIYSRLETTSTDSLRSTVGPFYPRRMTAETKGVEWPGGTTKFNATWYQAPTVSY